MNEQEAVQLLESLGQEVDVGRPDVPQIVSSGRRDLLTRRGLQLAGCLVLATVIPVVGSTVFRQPAGHEPATAPPVRITSKGPPPSASTATREHLWHLARQLARSNGGTVKVAQAVKSTRAHAERVVSGDRVVGNQPVWVIQVEGTSRFVCTSCSHPFGAKPPGGRFLTLSVDATTFDELDFGIGQQAVDLSRLGTVIRLHG